MAPGCLRGLTFSFGRLKKVPGHLAWHSCFWCSVQLKGQKNLTYQCWLVESEFTKPYRKCFYECCRQETGTRQCSKDVLHDFTCNIIHHFECDKWHGFLKQFLFFSFRQNGSLGTVFRRNCQYFSDRQRVRLAKQSNLFLYKTEVTVLTSMQMSCFYGLWLLCLLG